MKKLRILMIVSALIFISLTSVKAQIGISVNLNLQPQWGPVNNDYVEYYYLPEYDIYYNAPQAQFVYMNGGNWVFTTNLPYRYRNVNLYRTYKVVINEPKPYLRHDYYQSHYKQYKNVHSKQVNIRDSRDPRYSRGNDRQDNSKNSRVGNDRYRYSQPKSYNSRNESRSNNQGDKGNKGNKESQKGNKGNKNKGK
jgi:hypothetical protein